MCLATRKYIYIDCMSCVNRLIFHLDPYFSRTSTRVLLVWFQIVSKVTFFFSCVISKDAQICQGDSEIKSCAVVKYSAAPPPTSYALLQEKTDLKLPPANWLRESPQLGSAGTTILGSSSKSKPFSRYNYLKNCAVITSFIWVSLCMDWFVYISHSLLCSKTNDTSDVLQLM